jgi:ATP/maltotriose-dependent transcriptional regulator MalT
VLGLAALTSGTQIPSTGVPHALYRYFADEVFQAADADTQLDLSRLALAQVFDENFAQSVLGERAARTLREGIRLGVFSQDRDDVYLVHPLLREFLEMQLRSRLGAAHDSTSAYVGECLLKQERWDEAFDLANRFGDLQLAERVLEHSLDPLLHEGRIATITRWLEQGTVAHLSSASFDLAEAEVAFRLAEHEKAEALAAQAATRLPEGHALRSRAFARAGRSALIASREHESLEYFRRARASARTARDTREALVGLYFAASELGLSQSATFLAELANLDDDSPEAALRVGVARLTEATREGAIGEAVARERRVRHLAPRASDPLAATSFLHMLANGLNLLGQYKEAYEVIDEILQITRRYRLDMPVPHALLNRALAQHGQRDFRAAHASLDAINAYVPPGGDAYLEYNAGAIRARLLVSEGRLEEALVAVQRPASEIPSPALRSEYLGSQAFVRACLGEKQRPRELFRDAMATFSRSVESRVLGACALAIAEGEEASSRFDTAARRAWGAASETGNLDGIVCGYRGYPPLLRVLFKHEESRPSLDDLLSRAGDERLARRLGLDVRPSTPRTRELLTPRETDVLELLGGGLSNRAIAQALVVSEATVKVHLRHIYEKLGVRTRAEALAQTLKP